MTLWRVASAFAVVAAVAGCASAASPHGGAPAARVGKLPPRRFEAAPARGVDAGVRSQRLQTAVPRLEAILAAAVEDRTFPGLAAGVVLDDQLIWAHGFGHADLASRRPVTRETLFRIASITKTFVGVGLLQQYERGAFSWDDPVGRIVPEVGQVVYPTRDSPRITWRHLVTHTAGFPGVQVLDYAGDASGALSEAELLSLLRGLRLQSAPGTRVRYSNLGAAVAAIALGRLVGQDPMQVLADGLIRPLGMRRSAWAVPVSSRLGLAVGYRQKADGAFSTGQAWQLRAEAPVVGLYSNVEEMARYVAFHLRAWPPGDGPPSLGVSPAGLRSSHVVFGPAIPGQQAYGIFWMVDADPTLGHVVHHSGSTALYSATAWLMPRRRLGVVLLANTGNVASQRLDELAREVLLTLLDADPDPAPQVPRAVTAALNTVKSLLLEPSLQTIRRRFSSRFLQSVPAEELMAFFERQRRTLGSCREHHVLRWDSEDTAVVRLYCAEGEMRVTVQVQPSPPHAIVGLILEAFPQKEPPAL